MIVETLTRATPDTLAVGDIVRVPRSKAQLAAEDGPPSEGVVRELYPRFAQVQFPSGYFESYQYLDLKVVRRLELLIPANLSAQGSVVRLTTTALRIPAATKARLEDQSIDRCQIHVDKERKKLVIALDPKGHWVFPAGRKMALGNRPLSVGLQERGMALGLYQAEVEMNKITIDYSDGPVKES